MRKLVLVTFVLVMSSVANAGAASISYIDGDSVWLSSPDGSKKSRLAGPANDGRAWTEQTQSDNGRVLAVRREPGKIAPLNTFTIWGPDGKEIYQGSLIGQPGWTSYAYPVSLDLTADGRNVVYGYSNMTYGYPVSQFETGTYVIYADRFPAGEPFRIPGEEFPTVFGSQIVTSSDGLAYVQNPGAQTPFGDDFTPWIDTTESGLELTRTDVAANGKAVAIELEKWDGGTRTVGKIVVSSIPSLGGDLADTNCFLPAQGVANEVSLAQDGSRIAWHDDRGVVSAGIPDFTQTDPVTSNCKLSSPAVVISATGERPSIGAAAIPSSNNGGGGGGNGGGGGGTGGSGLKLTVPANVKASSLKKGLKLKVRVVKAGKVTVQARLGKKLVASGSAKAKKAGTLNVVLKSTRAWKSKLAKLKGKTVTLKVTSGGKSTTVKKKLK